MKHKTAELTGALLDAAVAKTLGLAFVLRHLRGDGSSPIDKAMLVHKTSSGTREDSYYPSSRWEVGGPIIEHFARTSMVQMVGGDGDWSFYTDCDIADGALLDHGPWGDGPTPLIAGMRAIVAYKFGPNVELP